MNHSVKNVIRPLGSGLPVDRMIGPVEDVVVFGTMPENIWRMMKNEL